MLGSRRGGVISAFKSSETLSSTRVGLRVRNGHAVGSACRRSLLVKYIRWDVGARTTLAVAVSMSLTGVEATLEYNGSGRCWRGTLF